MKNELWRITLDTNPEDCNLHCVMCEEHSPYSDFIARLGRRRRMPKEWLRPIFEQAKALGVKEIIPSTMGEPLIYKHFPLLLELCHEYQIRLNLTTNATFPKVNGWSVEDWAKKIVPVTSDVKFSWNGAAAATASKVMIGLDFAQALANVEAFIRYRNEYYQANGVFCRVTFQLTFMQSNMRELANIIQLAASLGVDRVKGHHLWAHFQEIQEESFRKDKTGIEQWNLYVAEALEAQEKFRKPGGAKVILENIYPLTETETQEVPYSYNCPFLQKELWISATGKISPCCAPDTLRDSLGGFGNICDTTLSEALEGEAYQHLLQNYKEHPLCKTCNMRKPENSAFKI
jgi:MoaA/NifB/PqqE/SkfB family radical SAM enzyme